MENERGVCSKDLIKPHHRMSYCDFRDQDRAVCVCSVQLWIISTLFLLWPTCTESRSSEYAHVSTQVFLPAVFSGGASWRSSPQSQLWYVKLSISVREQVAHTHRAYFSYMGRQCEATLLHLSCGALARCLMVYKQFLSCLRFLLVTWIFMVYGLKLPSALYFIRF